MTTDVKPSREALTRREESSSPLLPLPNSGSGFYEDNVWHDTFSKRQMESYARANMEPLIAENERLAEALRELEEREQRDEALLRQALGRAHQTAMEQTLKARTPECAEFAGIAQDLDFVVAALRERLGVKA